MICYNCKDDVAVAYPVKGKLICKACKTNKFICKECDKEFPSETNGCNIYGLKKKGWYCWKCIINSKIHRSKVTFEEIP